MNQTNQTNQTNQIKTPEQIEYEEALKHLHDLSLKASLSAEGIDTTQVSLQQFDEIKRNLEKQNKIRSKAQDKMNKIQAEMNAELNEVHKEVSGIVESIKKEQGIMPVEPPKQPEPQEPPEPQEQSKPPETESTEPSKEE